jgi:hypothetical protein
VMPDQTSFRGSVLDLGSSLASLSEDFCLQIVDFHA